MFQNPKKKIIIAVTGASGSVYAKQLFEKLQNLLPQIEEAAVIFSDNAKKIWDYEIGDESYLRIPFKIYDRKDFSAPFASGSARYDTMIICPCSMGTLGRIAQGVSDDLITRAADVILKERRKLILVTREAPLNLIHINNMKLVTEAGGVICPANPSFYSKPQSINDLISSVTNRVMDLAGFDITSFRWGNNNPEPVQ
ncbi:MAG: UbiX family flavin prenyltransferase [Bacteroidia bacterium]|nr:UbiX family flavin prenyltransferase [Bacteroidia bacterium]